MRNAQKLFIASILYLPMLLIVYSSIFLSFESNFLAMTFTEATSNDQCVLKWHGYSFTHLGFYFY